MIVWISVCRALAWLEERIRWSVTDRPLRIVADDLVARSRLRTGAALKKEWNITASHRNATAGASDRNAVAIDIRDVNTRTIVLRRAE